MIHSRPGSRSLCSRHLDAAVGAARCTLVVVERAQHDLATNPRASTVRYQPRSGSGGTGARVRAYPGRYRSRHRQPGVPPKRAEQPTPCFGVKPRILKGPGQFRDAAVSPDSDRRLVLLVACANVANLMLARAASRRRETAVCLAIGAGRWRLVRQRMAEALLLAMVGGLVGLVLAIWGTSVLKALISGALPISLDISPDTRVLAFAMVTSCATAVLFGLLPALRATGIDSLRALKTGGGADRGIARIPLGRTLVVTQIVVSLVLLVTAGLFVRSLLNLREIELGFDPDRVLLFRMTPPAAEQPVSLDSRRNLYRQLLARAESVPGITSASASFSGVFSRGTWRNAITVEGFLPRSGVTPRTFANSITPDYFDVMRIAVLRGRPFTDADHETAPKVAVVNDTFGRQFFGDADAIREARRILLKRSVRAAKAGDGDRRRHGGCQIRRSARRESAFVVRSFRAA